MGHFCRICKLTRANEKFSGKGHRVHVCKDCMRLPKDVRDLVDREDEIAGFLNQSRISDKNLLRLGTLTASNEPRIAELAALVLEVARVAPNKKRRLSRLARERRDLLDALEESGLIPADHWQVCGLSGDCGRG